MLFLVPLLIAPPAARSQGRQQLPDRFRLARPSATVPVEVFIHRTIELGTWLLDAKVGSMLFAWV